MPMNLRGIREDLAGTKGSIEIGEESLIREMEVTGEMGGIEETAVGAEESAEEAAMKAKGTEALQITKGLEDDLLEQRSIRNHVTSEHHQQRGDFILHFDTWTVSESHCLGSLVPR